LRTQTQATARERLQDAALTLFRNNGFEATTATEIAAKAGVTERTFFRYFSDKREVLFDGEERVREGLLSAVAAAPDDLGSLDALFTAFRAFQPELEGRRDYAAPRQQIIDLTPSLQERELAKIAAMSDALAKALEDRGVPSLEAILAARTGMAAFAHATAEWFRDDTIGLDERFGSARRIFARMLEGAG
jgi:AcrR family transcriptional regulator